MPLLVYIKGFRGPEPQIVMEDQRTGEGKPKVMAYTLLGSHTITEEEAASMTVKELCDRYPPPEA